MFGAENERVSDASEGTGFEVLPTVLGFRRRGLLGEGFTPAVHGGERKREE